MADSNAKKLPAHKDKTKQFQPGQIANPKGRPKGSRNKLGEAFISALQDDFTEHGQDAIVAVRTDKPDAYLKVIASVIPKDMNINVNKYDDMTDEQLIERLRVLRESIAPLLADSGAGGGGNDKEATRH